MSGEPTARESAVRQSLRTALRGHYGARLTNLILFGSRARGEGSDDVDFDVLVVLEGTVDPTREREAVAPLVYRVCWDNDAVVSCHFATTERYARERSPLLMNVRREGVPA